MIPLHDDQTFAAALFHGFSPGRVGRASDVRTTSQQLIEDLIDG
jgi:hypothetical protein